MPFSFCFISSSLTGSVTGSPLIEIISLRSLRLSTRNTQVESRDILNVSITWSTKSHPAVSLKIIDNGSYSSIYRHLLLIQRSPHLGSQVSFGEWLLDEIYSFIQEAMMIDNISSIARGKQAAEIIISDSVGLRFHVTYVMSILKKRAGYFKPTRYFVGRLFNS